MYFRLRYAIIGYLFRLVADVVLFWVGLVLGTVPPGFRAFGLIGLMVSLLAFMTMNIVWGRFNFNLREIRPIAIF